MSTPVKPVEERTLPIEKLRAEARLDVQMQRALVIYYVIREEAVWDYTQTFTLSHSWAAFESGSGRRLDLPAWANMSAYAVQRAMAELYPHATEIAAETGREINSEEGGLQ